MWRNVSLASIKNFWTVSFFFLNFDLKIIISCPFKGTVSRDFLPWSFSNLFCFHTGWIWIYSKFYGDVQIWMDSLLPSVISTWESQVKCRQVGKKHWEASTPRCQIQLGSHFYLLSKLQALVTPFLYEGQSLKNSALLKICFIFQIFYLF